jgi:hypothetical protein
MLFMLTVRQDGITDSESRAIMETFLEILREVLKGIMRELSAYFFRKAFLENKKTTLRELHPNC